MKIDEGVERQLLGLIGIARRAGRAVVGADAIRGASRKHGVFAVVVAVDATSNAAKRISGLGPEVAIVRACSKENLGRAVGRGVAAVVGVTDRELAARVVALGDDGGRGP